jgi:WD40 repeat protein
VRTWDAITGDAAGPTLTGHDSEVTAVATGRPEDRDIVISGSRDGSVRTWDAATGDPLGPTIAEHHGPVIVVATGRAGDRDVIISGDSEGTVRVDEYRPR